MAKTEGKNSSETLNGTRFNDEISARGGNDTIRASRGNDTLNGGSGSDTVNYGFLDTPITLMRMGMIDKGGLGIDLIEEIETIIGNRNQANSIDGSTSGASGETSFRVRLDRNPKELRVLNVPPNGETLKFNIRNFDNITGTSRRDIIVGDDGNNELDGAAGNDFINGNRGDDILRGGRGNDELRGAKGDDVLFGLFDNDILKGNRGNDRLGGGAGNDTLIGGSGIDFLVGSRGADDFRFDSFSDQVDTIEDFNFREGDKIVIGFSDRINLFSENEATGEILFNGVAFARVTPNQGSNFFRLDQDILFV